MTPVQEKAFALLCEIDDICRDNDIGYSLTEDTAVMAMTDGQYNSSEYMTEIMMTPSGYKKFRDAVKRKNQRDRTVEDFSSNRKMNGLFGLYVDRNTTLIDFIRGSQYEEKGIYVRIRVLRPDRNLGRVFGMFETCSAMNNVPHLRYSIRYSRAKRKMLFVGVALLRPFFQGKGFAKKQFERILSSVKADEDAKTAFVYRLDVRSSRKFTKGTFAEYSTVRFEDRDFMIAGNRDSLAKQLKKVSGKQIKTDSNVGRQWEIIAEDVPFAQFVDEAKSKGLYDNETQKHVDRHLAYRTYRCEPFERKANSDWRYIRRTFDRFELWEKYQPIKEEIICAYEEGREDKVRDMMTEFGEVADYYANFNMGFAFDKELFDVYCETADKPNKEEYVKKMKRLLPKEFEENMGEYLGRQGAVHPLINGEKK